MSDTIGSSADETVGIRLTPARRHAFFMAIDSLIVAVAITIAFLLRFDASLPTEFAPVVPVVAGAMATSTLLAFRLLRVYDVSWTYFGFRDIVRVAVGVATATVVTGVFVQVLHTGVFQGVPRSVVLIQAPLVFLGIATFRLSERGRRLVKAEVNGETDRGSNTLIIGAGDAGHHIAKSLQDVGNESTYNLVGFLDDDRETHGMRIHGAPVRGSLDTLERQVSSLNVEVVIIAIAEADSWLVRDIDGRSRSAGAETVRIVPPISQLIDDEITVSQTEEVSIEDLLGRDPVEIDQAQLRDHIQGRCIVVTGAAGTIGSELARQVLRYDPAKLVLLDIDESRLHDLHRNLEDRDSEVQIESALVDIRDSDALASVFQDGDIDLVFHAAAYKHVPLLEEWPLQSLETNVFGTYNVLQAAADGGCEQFVLISTDKAVDPSNNMGASKQLAEELVFNGQADAFEMDCSAVRFGNVLGSRGSVIPIFERQLERGGPLTVTHPDVERYFMTTREAVSLVLEAASIGEHGDLLVLDMGAPVKILDLANEFIRLHGLEPGDDVPIEFIGLRDGEKLSEELACQCETLRETNHDSIYRIDRTHSSQAPVDMVEISAAVQSRNASAADQILDDVQSIHGFLHPLRDGGTSS